MFQRIASYEGIYARHQAERNLFEVDAFVPGYAAFPQQVFHKLFSRNFFLDFNDWFNESDDYARLQTFLQQLEEPFCYASVPLFYLLNPVQFSPACSHSDFVNGFTYNSADNQNDPASGVGLRLSSQTFIYGESQTWAMVSDLTHNIIIVGLDESAVPSFESSFADQYYDIRQVIANLEAAQGAKMDDATSLIARYP